MRPSPIAATVDFERDGIQHGFLRLPHSRDDSAWGSIMIPLTVFKNGEGPTALLSGANHGDEYEGPVALFDLAASLNIEEVSGRIIVVPAMNYPAFAAASRTSPIDRGNLNRSFPGRPDGSITEKIADYFTRTLLPMSDVVVDIHAGGKTLDFVPFACSHRLRDKKQEAACIAAVRAFNAPYSVLLLEIDNVGMYDTTVEEMGKIFVSTELGGGGSSSARSNAIAKRGIRNVLIHAGIVRGAAEFRPTVGLDMPSGDCFTFCGTTGILELMVDLGAAVTNGQMLARIWPIDRTGAEPEPYFAKMDGILVARHFPGLIKPGDCLTVIATTANDDPS